MTALPRPEYPRPQLVRNRWLNLNGVWEFAFDGHDVGRKEGWFDGRTLPEKIIVPFAYQTELSGIHDKGVHEVVWYARSFEVPADWRGQDLLLHFGAVDYAATVWLNGQEVGGNRGGHVPFSFNIEPYIKEGANRLTLRVEDRQDAHQPRGKQAVSGIPGSVDYYCTTGIWQTVWLEPVGTMRIEDLRITPLFKQSALEVMVYLHAPAGAWTLKVSASLAGKEVVKTEQKTTNATARLVFVLPSAKLWTPENPHLYDLRISLHKDGKELDAVESYAGMRSVQVENGRVCLNEQPYYLIMALDQGYWPEGGMTAPTDTDLRADVEWAKRYGFNGVRKHQKIEDPRWLYWCDRLGLLVWGEMANARAWSSQAEEMLMSEWERAVRRDYNHPCIITWVPMNESWGVPGLTQNHPGQFAYLERIVALTRRLDSFRPVVDNDGWEHTDITDICAIHDYAPTPEVLKERYAQTVQDGSLPKHVWANGLTLFSRSAAYHGQPVVLTEVGGFLMIPPHIPEGERDDLYRHYGTANSGADLLSKYENLMKGIAELPFVCGFCYTQLYDVEHEINGLLSYGRTPKIEPETIAAIHRQFPAGGKK